MSQDDSSHHDNTEDALQQLRNLLFVKETTRIDEIEEQLSNPEVHAQEVAKVLAEAIKIRNKSDDDLGKSLAPNIEKSIKESIARDPKALSDALFPVMGPAIRKSIQNSIAEMLQSLNQTLEHSFSSQGLKWRMEAFRTNKSFAEVVMLNTLVYRVEQVFLIHKETGLLLRHVSFDPALNEDADVISSMLTAVQDFIQDSFSGSTDQGIENLRMGDLEVVIEQGPHFVLAVVCRGNTPRSFSEKIQTVVEDIQKIHGEAFKTFEGDTEPFANTDEQLQPLLVSDFKENSDTKKKGSPIKLIVTAAVILITIIVWWTLNQVDKYAAQTAWDNYIERLELEPGIIISSVQQDDNHYTILGLRDPLSLDPYSLASNFDFKNIHIDFHMQPYHALQSELVLKRVTQLIQPPKSVLLSLENGTLNISGVTSEVWLSQAEKAALYVAGVDNIDSRQASVLTTVFESNHIDIPIKLDSLPSKPKKTVTRKVKKTQTALTDKEILKRAIFLLKPPNTVTMLYSKGILYVSGKASKSWIEFAKDNFSRVDYVNSFYTSNLSSKGVK
ncbi:MAG: hypothetical protein R8M14_04210 [Ghiorsea sp.]